MLREHVIAAPNPKLPTPRVIVLICGLRGNNSVSVKSEARAVHSLINQNAEKENDWSGFFSACTKSSAAAGTYAAQIASTGMTDRTAPGLQETPLAKEIRQTRP